MKVSIIAAVSADGFIARQTHELVDWSSKEDKKVFVKLTKRAGVMVMGRTTYETIGRPLPGRKTVVYSHSMSPQEGITITQADPRQLLSELETEGYSEVAICGGSTIYDLFLRASLVTDIYLTVEPIIFGSGVSLFTSPADIRLNLKEVDHLAENVILLHYEVYN